MLSGRQTGERLSVAWAAHGKAGWVVACESGAAAVASTAVRRLSDNMRSPCDWQVRGVPEALSQQLPPCLPAPGSVRPVHRWREVSEHTRGAATQGDARVVATVKQHGFALPKARAGAAPPREAPEAAGDAWRVAPRPAPARTLLECPAPAAPASVAARALASGWAASLGARSQIKVVGCARSRPEVRRLVKGVSRGLLACQVRPRSRAGALPGCRVAARAEAAHSAGCRVRSAGCHTRSQRAAVTVVQWHSVKFFRAALATLCVGERCCCLLPVQRTTVAGMHAQEPVASSEGLGGTYFFSSEAGGRVGIMKPVDEEPLAPNNPKARPTAPWQSCSACCAQNCWHAAVAGVAAAGAGWCFMVSNTSTLAVAAAGRCLQL